MDEDVSKLESEYCPPVDSALFYAIIQDYDLHNHDQLLEAKSTLDSIKASAEEEAGSDFDASGSTFSHPDGNLPADGSVSTDLTSLSNGVARLQTTDEPHHSHPSPDADVNLDTLPAETQCELLRELFPEVSTYTVSHTIKKVNGSWQRALDELLNVTALSSQNSSDDEAVLNKSIDAFSADQVGRRERRGKRKNRQRETDERRAGTQSLPQSDSEPVTNKWQSASRDIHFVATHANLSNDLVRSAYYANSASVSKTIASLLKDVMKSTTKVTTNDQTVQAHAVELGQDFPTIAPAYLTALIQLTHPSTASAHELAKALTIRPETPSNGPIIPQYAAPSLSDDETSSLSTSSTVTLPVATGAARDLAVSHRTAHQRLSEQAAAAYRRSRSNHLYGGAASYYSSVSREHAASASSYISAAADALVASQSSASQLDLHGVTVADAVRIARREVERWWAGMGEARVNGRVGANDRAKGFNIVVGIGRHSEGGKGKIGPAVVKMLNSEGWRAERQEGVVVVRGKART